MTPESRPDRDLDLLSIPERELRSIRGNRIAMIFQDPGKALNPALSIRDQVSEVFYEHRSDELLAAPASTRRPGRYQPHSYAEGTQQSRTLENLLLSLPPLRSRRSAITAAVDDRVADALAETQIPNPRASWIAILMSYRVA